MATELEIPSEENALMVVRVWCASELKMPIAFVKSISIEKVEKAANSGKDIKVKE